MRKRLARLGLVLLPGLALTLAARAEAPETTRFWDTDFVHVIHLRVTPKQWQLLQPTKQGMLPRVAASEMAFPSAYPTNLPVLPPGATKVNAPKHEGDRLDPNFYGLEFAYVKAGVECDGEKLADAGLKQRGNSSYRWGVSAGHKRPFKLDFNRFVTGQTLHGISSFHLNNNAYDPSFLREALGYEFFRQLGVPAPRTTFALLYLTIDGQVSEEFLGLYLVLEEIDSKAFLKSHFDSAKGLLLKPWSIAGLPYFGEQWPAYEPRYNSRTAINPLTARRTIDFIKLVNYAADATFRARIGQYLDVEEFLHFLAGQVIIANMDSILITGHNFYLFLDCADNRFRFLPWDLNLAFANNHRLEHQQAVQLSLLHPHAGEAKLIDRLLAVPQYKEKYLAIFQQCLARDFNAEKLLPRIDALQSVLTRADQAAAAAWAARWVGNTNAPARPVPQLTGWDGKPAMPLKDFVTQRVASIRAQLSGEAAGFIPIGR
jgi:spore coat protein CotH